MFCLAVYTGSFFPQAKLILIPFAVVIAYSRVYNGVHYPSDVLAGALAGVLIGLAIAYLAKYKVMNYIKNRSDRNTGSPS